MAAPSMNIAYYMPFKPLGHPNPSGDLVTGTEMHDHLNLLGHDCRLMSKLRCRWIYYHPLSWPKLATEFHKISHPRNSFTPDLWLTYHTYYKAPDLLGPLCSKRLNIPYVIFQGIYSTKRRKRLKTLPGFYLNRYSLLKADLVFTNKKKDLKNLRRLLPEERIRFIPPGIHSGDFTFCRESRNKQRRQFGIGNETVVLTAAMFRPGVKTLGILQVIESCATLLAKGINLRLVIAGGGSRQQEIHDAAARMLPGKVTFCGRIPRKSMSSIYSSADVFAFPGIEESLGMVYLEAQSCGLPVVAFEDWGGGEAVLPGTTGLLSPAEKPELFTENIGRLVRDRTLARQMGLKGAAHIRTTHELHNSYRQLNEQLSQVRKIFRKRFA